MLNQKDRGKTYEREKTKSVNIMKRDLFHIFNDILVKDIPIGNFAKSLFFESYFLIY